MASSPNIANAPLKPYIIGEEGKVPYEVFYEDINLAADAAKNTAIATGVTCVVYEAVQVIKAEMVAKPVWSRRG